MKVGLGIVLGALCAGVIACGGAASKQASVMPRANDAGAMPPGPGGGGGRAESARGQEIEALDHQIDGELARMNLARPATPPSACIEPPCAPGAMAAGIPSSQADPACKPGASETCGDSCKLADSICDASDRICRIATELGGNDRYANDRCASGQASCTAAHARCCGCL
jgi:hypothetical protein